jgi:hypothetical protein
MENQTSRLRSIGVLAEQVGAEELAEPGPLPGDRRARAVAHHTIVGGDPDQGEAVLGLRHARDPGGVEGRWQRDGNVKELDLRNPVHCGSSRAVSAPYHVRGSHRCGAGEA